MKKHIYFVSYNWQSHFQNGCGNTEITGLGPIDSIKDIQNIQDYIKKDLVAAGISNPSVQVMYYQLLREEECD